MRTLRQITAVVATSLFMMYAFTLSAQMPELQNFRDPGLNGINQFEAPKTTDVEFDGLDVRVGGDFAIQFQGLSQTNSGDSLPELGSNFNLPTANLNLDVQLHNGVRLHMRTYLSARHHAEAWVKGGYMQIDRLDFIQEDFLSNVMDVTRFRFGMDMINYGDMHFRRSDNARAIYNPFVGNYMMDGFTTEPFGEVTVFPGDFIIVLGMTNGRLNQSVTSGDEGMVVYGKLGYDNQVNEDLRVRLTGSFYNSSSGSTRDYLYGGDRAGSRYYSLFNQSGRGADFEGRFNPGFGSHMAIQINPFIKFKGLEFFGAYEMTSNNADGEGGGGSYSQLAADLLYRFGGDEQFYIGGRYNSISGTDFDGADERNISRINVGGGWFMTNNVLAKLEYVTSSYEGAAYDGTMMQGAEFNGVVIEAVIGF